VSKHEYGLIGRRLSHSCSPELHNLLRGYQYDLIELEPEELEPFIRAGKFRGLNVTIPYKREALLLCDSLSERAGRVGAVNTVVRRPDGSLFGDNTDCAGFIYMCERAGISFAGERVLILGSGGTSRAALCAAEDMGAAEITVISRSGENTYKDLPAYRHYTHVVNTTPVGMYPRADGSPLINLKDFPDCGGVVDVIYNPLRTRLLQEAEALGIPASNGLSMLAAQAKYSSDLFTGEALPDSAIEKALSALLKTRENIALVGMPGCGKSTVGRLLAEGLGLRFVDIDAEIEARAGHGIPEIFARDGEEAFRDLESDALTDLCSHGGQVIAAGGGAVLRPQNIAALKWNSRVVWLRRSLDKLALNGRPLSADRDALARLWAERESFYRAAADIIVDNDTESPADCALFLLNNSHGVGR